MEQRQALTQAEKWQRYEECAEIVLVDFDGTLCEFQYPDLGPPLPGARRFLKGLLAMGLKPVIWSSRMSSEIYTEQERADAIVKIGRWMIQHNMPFSSIDTGESGKRLCLAYVDDRGVHANGNFDAMLMRVRSIKEGVEAKLRAHRRGEDVERRH